MIHNMKNVAQSAGLNCYEKVAIEATSEQVNKLYAEQLLI